MKYVVLVGDGMSDYPLDELGGRTPLEAADTSHMDDLARRGELGLARTIPKGMPPGSDIGNISIFGYDPRRWYTGRGPLEAINMGIELAKTDIAFRCNTVCIRDGVMADFSAGHITSNESRLLMQTLDEELGRDGLHFYGGVSYRHLLVIADGPLEAKCTPPHDISGKPIQLHVPQGPRAEQLLDLMDLARPILAGHPVNHAREAKGQVPATDIWPWGQGKVPNMPSYPDRFGLHGAVVSAVDLVKGIGRCLGLEPVSVPGATGYVDTNYEGKVEAALKSLKKGDFVFLHVEAPDEAGHEGDLKLKIRAIEDFDKRIVGPIVSECRNIESTILTLCDHPTPISLRTHHGDPVPFVIARPGDPIHAETACYSERCAAESGLMIEEGHKLIERFFSYAKGA